MDDVQLDSNTERIKSFLIEKFPLARKRNVQLDDSLIDSGIVDSLGILDLVSFLEGQFGMQISDEELLPENFQTIKCIADLVKRKTNHSASAAQN
jgi:acyl carrier protein